MIALKLERLAKSYGPERALDGIDLEVEEGDFCVLLGPSGCGKTTALRCVAGLEEPSAGSVWIHGRPVDGLPPRERDVAMVFQSYALYPHMTARRNLAFPLVVRGLDRSLVEDRVKKTARLLRIEHLLDRRPRQLSGGERQRVAIGRAIVRAPKLFLFDEPLSNLDARLRTEMREELARLHRRLGTTMLYVTHDQVEAMTLGRTIVVMHRGRVEQVGTPEAIYERPATRFVASFVGTPPMNFLSGRIEGGCFRAGVVAVSLASERAGPCEVGIRPERIRLGGGDGRGQVEWVENRGADAFAHVRCGAGDLVIRLPAGVRPTEGEEVSFAFDPAAVHVFR